MTKSPPTPVSIDDLSPHDELTAHELAARINEKVRSVSTIVSQIPGVTTFRAGERRVKYRLELDPSEPDADHQQIKNPGGELVDE